MACGGTISGTVVERGHIPGQSWDQRACADGRNRIAVEFDLPEPGYVDGGGMDVPHPSTRRSLFIDMPGQGWGSRHESEIDGVTFSSVDWLRLTFAHGAALTVPTRQAPARLRRRFPYLRHLRFFVVWFAGSRGLPTQVCGLGVHRRAGACFRHVAGPPIWIPRPARA
jgi:hypothetical protein